jgi:hypothetical protein
MIGLALFQQLQRDLAVALGALNWETGSPSQVEAEPGQAVEDRRVAGSSVERSRSVSSMRSSILPPVWRA